MKLKVYTADGSTSSEKEFALPAFEGDKGRCSTSPSRTRASS
jgi:hypothetical protein